MIGHCFIFMFNRGLEKAVACNSRLRDQTELLSLVWSTQVPLALGEATLATIPGSCFVYFCFPARKANVLTLRFYTYFCISSCQISAELLHTVCRGRCLLTTFSELPQPALIRTLTFSYPLSLRVLASAVQLGCVLY